MSEKSIEVNESDINAKTVDIVGENQYKIANSTFNIDVSAPTYDNNIKHLENSLKANRESLDEDFGKLEKLIINLNNMESGNIQAIIKDILIGSRNIELLIPPIRLNGGKVNSLPNETGIVKRINETIRNGVEIVEENLSELQDRYTKYLFEWEEVMKFKFGRSSQEKKQQVDNIDSKMKKIKPKIEDDENFLNTMK
jgi:flagellar biosynthesis chaperone FliJ